MSTAHPLSRIARDPWGSLRRGGADLYWYLKEIMGENAYLHYLESYERRHGTREGAMEEKAFWRDLGEGLPVSGDPAEFRLRRRGGRSR